MKLPRSLPLYIRFAGHLAWEFRWPLVIFTLLVLVGGFALQLVYDERPLSYAEACYGVFLLVFFQPYLAFPDEWYLQPFFFLIPVVGLGAVADSLVRLGYLVFARKRNLPEWQRMIASSYDNHFIVVGVGKVGLRIIRELTAVREPVVAIERLETSTFLDEIQDLDVPVIFGNGRQAKTLEQAGVKRARAIILATDDDLANLDAALTARDLNPAIRVVLRLFDDTLAAKFATVFQMPAISPARVSASAFIAAATGRKVYHDFELDGQHLHLIDLTVAAASPLVGRTVGQVQAERKVNIVMQRGRKGVLVNPDHNVALAAEDILLVMGPIERLVELETANRGT